MGADSNVEVRNSYFDVKCGANGTTLTNGKGSGFDEKAFKSGELAYLLQSGHSESSAGVKVLVWGQNLVATDEKAKDDYPVLTNSAEDEVYRVTLSENTPGTDSYSAYKYAYGNMLDTITLPEYTGANKDMFFGWSTTKNGEKINGTYTVTGDSEVYTLWNGITFTFEGKKQIYNSFKREITFTPFVNGEANSSVTVTVKATSTKANYDNKTVTRTFVIRPKTINVTATATDRVYDGSKNVTVTLSTTDVLDTDTVNINYTTATVTTADVENYKTVFVSGITVDNANYQLSSNSVQTTVNITKANITAVTITAQDKVYDGTTDAKYAVTNLEGVIDPDKNFVTVTGNAKFNSANVATANEVTLTDLVLSGAKSGNYNLTATSAKASASISKALVNVTFGTLSYVYDAKEKTVPVTATLDGKPFDAFSVKYGGNTAVTNVGKYNIEITLDDENNYTTDYTAVKQLEIVRAEQSGMTITGLVGTIDYGRQFVLSAVGGADIDVVWSSSDTNVATVDEATGLVTIVGTSGPVTIKAEKPENGIFKKQEATVTFTPVKKAVSFVVTNLNTTYDGQIKNVTVTPNVLGCTDYVVKYSNENGAEVENPKDAGTYHVDVTAKADGNYEGSQSAVLTIKKAKINREYCSVTVTPESIVYGDNYEVKPQYYNLMFVNSGEGAVSTLLTDLPDSVTSTLTYSGSSLSGEQSTKPVGAGTYTAILTVTSDNYETEVFRKEFTIGKKTLTAKAENKERAYGEDNPALTVKLMTQRRAVCKYVNSAITKKYHPMRLHP